MPKPTNDREIFDQMAADSRMMEEEVEATRLDADRLANALDLLIYRLPDDISTMHEILGRGSMLTVGDVVNGVLALHREAKAARPRD